MANLKQTALTGLAALTVPLSFNSCVGPAQLGGTFETGTPNAKGEFVVENSKSARIRGGNAFNTEASLAFQEQYPCGTPSCAPARSQIVAGGGLRKESGSTTLANVGTAVQGASAAVVAAKYKPTKVNNNVKATATATADAAAGVTGPGCDTGNCE